MDTVVIYFGLAVTFVIAIAVAIFAWKVANFFIARREFYVTSPFDMMMKKLGWCLFWFLFTIYVGVTIIVPKKDRDQYLKSDKHKTTKQKDDK
ncbi:hypothetical protein [Flavobacterium sp.]|jgi:hypothetical protein|uniref:hypothetical protein n=1 Tax=Flavobacterium sp. TaxID=239 RepID=UPI002633368B|nr:hypothetical protein [Flavobacterium sp.]MDD2987269.1 hypothetical protein [Flavobacterium sp.]